MLRGDARDGGRVQRKEYLCSLELEAVDARTATKTRGGSPLLWVQSPDRMNGKGRCASACIDRGCNFY